MTDSHEGERGHSDLPLACNLSALDAGQRARRAKLAEIVRTNTTRIVDKPNGYELHLRRSDDMDRNAAELVGLEQRCCAFLSLGLRRDATTGDTVLEVSGGSGAKEFIAAELGVVVSDGRSG